MDRRLLVIDDDPSMLELLHAELAQRSFDVVTQTSPDAALRSLDDGDFGLILSDLRMGSMSGVDLCREVHARCEDLPVIVMSAYPSVEWAVASIRAGACDFVTKPFDMDDLALSIQRAWRRGSLRNEVRRLESSALEPGPVDAMVGESHALAKMRDVIARVAATDATVLVSGESGTGKELVARSLHARSGARSAGPFVALNCSAVPETLIESELFGHTKGAFTDARVARPGLFLQATGGTLFLDEIAELPLAMQPKLLRALQERTVRPVGSETDVSFDVRIIAATNRDLETEVRERRFREDLYYRINVVHVQVPPLRERGEDVLLLAQSFLRRCQRAGGRVLGLQAAVADHLASYAWPGNVRELQNCIERAVALSRFDHLGLEDLPPRIRKARLAKTQVDAVDPSTFLPMEEVERRHVLAVLAAVGGNKALTARLLQMDRRTIYRKLERWELEAARDGDGAADGREASR